MRLSDQWLAAGWGKIGSRFSQRLRQRQEHGATDHGGADEGGRAGRAAAAQVRGGRDDGDRRRDSLPGDRRGVAEVGVPGERHDQSHQPSRRATPRLRAAVRQANPRGRVSTTAAAGSSYANAAIPARNPTASPSSGHTAYGHSWTARSNP